MHSFLEQLQMRFSMEGVTLGGIPLDWPVHLLAGVLLALVWSRVFGRPGPLLWLVAVMGFGAKEILDLYVVWHYEPPGAARFIESLLDMAFSLGGVGLVRWWQRR